MFGAFYHPAKGYVIYIAVHNGKVSKGSMLRSYSSNSVIEVYETGLITPSFVKQPQLTAGSVGYILSNTKSSKEILVGDTYFDANTPISKIEPKQKIIKQKPMVYAGIFPEIPTDVELLSKAIDRVASLDSSLEKETYSKPSMGFGYKCGFSGVLHMDVFRERLEKEEGMRVILTPPTVAFKIVNKKNEEIYLNHTSNIPPAADIKQWEEPFVIGTIVTPRAYVKGLCDLCDDYRGKQINVDYSLESPIVIKYELPLCEIVDDFLDNLNSISSGYASFDYEMGTYKPTEISVIKMALNGEEIESLSYLIHKTKAHKFAKAQCLKLKSVIPSELFPIHIQGIVGSKVIARET